MTDNSTERVRRKRALDKAGIKHVKGYIRDSSMDEFNAMVDRDKPAVDRALKGESDERDGKDNQ